MWLARTAYRRLWRLHVPAVVLVEASPQLCLETLAAAAKPSSARLHLNELFTDGRRYYLVPRVDNGRLIGFRMRMNNRPYSWGRRTAMAATLVATFTPISDVAVSVEMRVKMRWCYLMRGMLLPLWISFIMLALTFRFWSPFFIALMLFLLIGSGLLGYRLNAILQAEEMVFFVQKALDDLPAATIPALDEAKRDTVTSTVDPANDVLSAHEFREQWQKFYDSHH